MDIPIKTSERASSAGVAEARGIFMYVGLRRQLKDDDRSVDMRIVPMHLSWTGHVFACISHSHLTMSLITLWSTLPCSSYSEGLDGD